MAESVVRGTREPAAVMQKSGEPRLFKRNVPVAVREQHGHVHDAEAVLDAPGLQFGLQPFVISKFLRRRPCPFQHFFVA